MQRIKTTSAPNPLWKRVMAALFLFAFLSIHTVAVSDKLHHAVHHDAKARSHDCVFVQALHGQCLTDTAPVSLPAPIVTEFTVAAVENAFVLLSRDYILLPGRAPPVSLA
jgi:hypothetical protein